MDYPKIGYHISISDPVAAIKRLEKDSVGYCQIFISNNRSLQPCTWSDQRIDYFRKEMNRIGVTVFIHGPYLLNLSNRNKENVKKCKDIIINQLHISDRIDAKGVVIHMGKAVTLEKEEAIKNYIISIKEILCEFNGNSKLILETAAGQGTEICTDIEDLANLFDSFTPNEKSKLGICIDTCHVFAAGNRIRNSREASKFYHKTKDLFGNYISLIHMNDSKAPFDSRKDRHADIGEGHIGYTPLSTLYDLYSKDQIPIVLETLEEESTYLEQIKSLAD